MKDDVNKNKNDRYNSTFCPFVRESISGGFVWGIWNNPLFGGLSLCTSTAYLQKTSLGKSARFLWRIPEIENLENYSVYWFFRVFPVIKGLGECRDEGKLHFLVKIFRIIMPPIPWETLEQRVLRENPKKVGVLWAHFSIRSISGALDFYLMKHSSSLAMRLPYFIHTCLL